MKISTWQCRVDTSYFTHNWETCGGQEHLIPSRTGPLPSRTGPSRWRGCNHCCHDNLQQDLADRRMANPMDPVLSHQTSQERQPGMISLISHPSKVMLKITLNILKPQVEKIIAEEQAGFRAGRTTTEQIFNLRILCQKYLQHQQDMFS